MEKNPKTLAELPETEAYVILTKKAVRVPGETLRPRGSEPVHEGNTVSYFDIQAFNNELEWSATLTELLQEGTQFRAFLLKPVKVKIKADIEKDENFFDIQGAT